MCARLNLTAIEASLRTLQRRFGAINRRLNAERSALQETELQNMLAGYRLVDRFIAQGTDLCSQGYSSQLLELNNVLLYGPYEPHTRRKYAQQLAASERYFYEQEGGGVRDLIEYYRHQQRHDAWDRAAMVYVRMLAQPQLFVEGNHRTGALMMSYLLVREGHPPFVLRPAIAKSYFDPSADIGHLKKRSLVMRFHGWRLRRYFVSVLKRFTDEGYLLPPEEGIGGDGMGGPELRFTGTNGEGNP